MTSDVRMPNQIDLLQQYYRFVDQESSDGSIFPSEDLLHSDVLKALLDDQLTPMLNAPSRLVSGSQFSKKYAFLMIAPFFASFTLFDQVMNFRSNNCELIPDDERGLLFPRLQLKKNDVVSVARMDRKEAVHQALEVVFNGNLRPVLESINEVASVPMPVLWENTAVYFYWLYETKLHSHDLEIPSSKIQEDFELILEASGEYFGQCENPLKKYYHPKKRLLKTNPPVRVRKTCCLYFEVNPERTFCKTCPRCLSGYTD